MIRERETQHIGAFVNIWATELISGKPDTTDASTIDLYKTLTDYKK